MNDEKVVSTTKKKTKTNKFPFYSHKQKNRRQSQSCSVYDTHNYYMPHSNITNCDQGSICLKFMSVFKEFLQNNNGTHQVVCP